MDQRDNHSTAALKDLMTSAPIDPEQHAAQLRSKVEARRRLENAKEDAKQNAEDLY